MSLLPIMFIYYLNIVGQCLNSDPKLLAYNTLTTVLITSQISVTIICDIQPTGVVTMATGVLHNGCNICPHDLPNIYVRPVALRPWAYIATRQFLMPMLQPLHT